MLTTVLCLQLAVAPVEAQTPAPPSLLSAERLFQVIGTLSAVVAACAIGYLSYAGGLTPDGSTPNGWAALISIPLFSAISVSSFSLASVLRGRIW